MRTHFLMASAALATLLFATPSATAANVLVNPGFEDAPFDGAEALPVGTAGTGWTGFNGVIRIQGAPEPIGAAAAQEGSVVLKAFGDAGAFQDFAALPGQTWDASAWVLNPNNADFIRNGGFGAVNIEFRGNGAIIGDPFTNNETNEFTPRGEWNLREVSGLAPDGTDTVRIAFYTPGGDTGAPRWDDASLSLRSVVIPEPGSLALLSLGAIGVVTRRRRRS